MSKNDFILRYIDKCNEVMESENLIEAERLQSQIIAAFGNIIDHIEMGLTYDETNYFGEYISRIDYIYNIDILKCKIESLYELGKTKAISSSEKNPGVTINNTNNNSNSNSNINNLSLDVLFNEVRDEIENNDNLGEEEITEILERIEEIENIFKSNETRNKKWFKLRNILEWVSTKGLTTGTAIINLISAVLKYQQR